MINIILLLVWFIGITTIPGLSILSILYRDLKRYETLELFILAIGIGISYLVIVSYLLDEFLIINLVTLTTSILPFPCLVILLYHKDIFHLLKNVRHKLKRDVGKDLLIKLKVSKINTSNVLLLLVLCFIVFFILNDLLKSIVLPARDPWFWLIESKKIAVTGHIQAETGSWEYDYLGWFPRGAAYFLALMILPNLINSYYIVFYIGTFLYFLQCLGVYTASKKLLNSDKFAIYSVLVYGTSQLVIWRGKIYITESVGLFLIAVLALFIIEKDLKAEILGLLTILGLGLISFSCFGPVVVPALLYIVLTKPYRISVMTVLSIISAGLLLPNFTQTILSYILSSTFSANISFFHNSYTNSYWTFGYSLAFSFIGVIYFLLNRSSERMFYPMCFLYSFILINFINLPYWWMNIRIYPVFSVFASTLAAQGLWSTIKAFGKVLTPLNQKGNIKSYMLHFFIVMCLVYQIYFGMVVGYHTTISRYHRSEDVAAALWLCDNSPENAVILVLSEDSHPYYSILYPRSIILNQSLYDLAPSELAIFCSQNNINYIVLEIDAVAQLIKANNYFKEIYRTAGMIIFEFST